MTVALLLAAAPDRLSAMAHPYQRAGEGPAVGAPWLDFMGDRLMSAGVRQVDVAMCMDAADGLRAVAAVARGTGEPVLVCTSSRALATPRDELAVLLGGTGTAALAADGALLVASKDLLAVADAAETLAARIAAGQQPGGSPGRAHRVSLRRMTRRTRVRGDLDSAVDSLIECLSGNGVRVVALDGHGARLAPSSDTGTGTGSSNGDGAGRENGSGRGLAPPAGTSGGIAGPVRGNAATSGGETGTARDRAGTPGRRAEAAGANARTSGREAETSRDPAGTSGSRASGVGGKGGTSGGPAGTAGGMGGPAHGNAGTWGGEAGISGDRAGISGGPAWAVGDETGGPGGPVWVPVGKARGRGRGRVRPPASPPEPGLVTEFVVAPVASRIARWAPVRGLAADAFTITAFALSVCAAAWFADGSRSSAAAGAGLLCVALPLRQARGWLAGSSRAATAFGSWLTALSGTAAEYAVYAGLAVGWAGVTPAHAWGYATVAMILLAVRQMTDGCYAAVAPRRGAAGGGHRLLRLTGQSIALPAGERTLLIAVTAAAWGPRIALTALIGWSIVALGYVLAERSVAGRPDTPISPRSARVLVGCRDDGPLASWIGSMVQGQLPPLLPAIAGITVTAMLATLGLHNLPGVLLLAPAVAMLLAALGAQSPHTGRFDWLVPPLLQTGEYIYLTAVAFAAGVPPPATYVLIAVIALHHLDVLARERDDAAPSPGATAAGLGWEGRMLVAGFGAMLGIETFVCIALAGYLWALFGWDSLTSWVPLVGGARSSPGRSG